ncbi:S8 family serine peptidase [Neptuniibacter sp. CAU 1671]|uniref:S8 family serine peptidase n=1 Tax=Neptuniibacter sp. CAU 1671 TaxID=3032593 RepID=UPI0023DBE853|nr:S8 family serine peptidase [Neptuniibacter sp. CAU 1671]MDF2181870.1 S8 family serine peptidase [Neptuniibacter sp. CAU 1671]
MPCPKRVLAAVCTLSITIGLMVSGSVLAAGTVNNNRSSAQVASDIDFGLSVRVLKGTDASRNDAGAKQDAEPPVAFMPAQIVVAGQPDDFQPYRVLKHLPQSGQVLLSVPPGLEKAFIESFRDEGVSADYNLIAEASEVVNDTYRGFQWHLDAVQANQAWDMATGSGVVVAVLDSGFDTTGRDGVNTCLANAKDFTGNSNGWIDGNGHGTHVSGTVAQITDNGRGVAGMAFGACVMPVKVLNDSGTGTFVDIAAGIYHAVDHGAKVINLSLGAKASSGMTTDSVLAPALDYAETHGVVVAAAAGNDNYSANVAYPASYKTTLAVGATDYNDKRAPYSNYGKYLDVMAPGGDVNVDADGDGYTDGVLQETVRDGRWSYFFYQGTSMATPHVSALAAMLLERDVDLSPAEVRDLIKISSVDLGAAGYDSVYGYGLIQAADALTTLAEWTVPAPAAENTAPVASFSFSCNKLACSFNGSGSTDADGSVVSYNWNFGDSAKSSGVSASHSYAAAGNYNVSLTVTDDKGATHTKTSSVTVTAPVQDKLTISLSGKQSWIVKTTYVKWSGSTASKVDIYRNGSIAATTANDGNHTLTSYGYTKYSYKVCNAGTQVCSSEAVY